MNSTTIDHDYTPDHKSEAGDGSKEVATVVVAGVEVDIDVAEEAAVLRKIDLFILPVMCVTFWLQVSCISPTLYWSCKSSEVEDRADGVEFSLSFSQYIDKSALAYASVFGLSKDLKLKGTQYSTLGSLFVSGPNLLKILKEESTDRTIEG